MDVAVEGTDGVQEPVSPQRGGGGSDAPGSAQDRHRCTTFQNVLICP